MENGAPGATCGPQPFFYSRGMRRPRNKRTPIVLRDIPPNWRRILIALARYRYLDTAHIFHLIGWTNTNAELALRKLFDAGLINRLPNNRFQRDRLKDGQVYELSEAGSDYLADNGLTPFKATWLKDGHYGNPNHNLNLCLATACIEVAYTKLGYRFVPWGEIYSRLPKEAQSLPSPYHFNTSKGLIKTDNLYSVEFGADEFMLEWLEIDLSPHGADEYANKAKGYEEIIYKGLYKQRFNMAQHSRVLTITNSLPRRDTMAKLATDKLFYFKAMPEYGDFRKAPQPALTILNDWHRAKHPPANLTEI